MAGARAPDGAAAPPPLVLASTSPRRRLLLVEAGIPFEAGPAPDVDETPPGGLEPPEAARHLAERKARAVAGRLPGRVVLAADTVVFLGREMLGKPADADDARRMLARLSGGTHGVATGVAVLHAGRLASGVAVARLTFRALSRAEIDAYVRGGEPLDKAGGYALQGGAAAWVERLEGEPDTVVGLPIALVRRLLREVGAPGGLTPPPLADR